MGEADMPAIVHYNRDRRRSSFTRPMRDPEEIMEGLRSLKAAKRELGRTMSLSGDKRRESREYGYVASYIFGHHYSPNHTPVRSSIPSFIRAIVCLSVYLSVCPSVFHPHSILPPFLSYLSHHHRSRSLDRCSERSVFVQKRRSADRIFLVGQRRAYRTHANICFLRELTRMRSKLKRRFIDLWIS